jgi:ankyrin repeat protein
VNDGPAAAKGLNNEAGEAEVAHELVLASLRFLNLTDWSAVPNEYLPQLAVIRRRNEEEPFYQVAANTWVGLLIRFPDQVPTSVKDEACRLFASVRQGNFMSWFIELMMEGYQSDVEAERAAMYVNTCNVLAKSVSPLHIAACLSLDFLCEALIRQGCDVNQQSRMGTPLYCAVVKPLPPISFFYASDSRHKWKHVRMADHLRAEKSQRATIRVLRDAGAAVPEEAGIPDEAYVDPDETASVDETGSSDGTAYMGLSYSTAVLMLSAKIRDVDFFTSLTRPEHYLHDEQFIRTLEDFDFPFAKSGASDPLTLAYLNGLCGFLIDQSWRPAFGEMWMTAWEKAYISGLRCSTFGDRRPLVLSDTDVAAFKDLIVSDRSSDQRHFMRWVQDDQREANFVTDPEDGETLLHLAVSQGNAWLVSALVEKAKVDISVRDRHGRTPLHLCEHERKELTTLISHGADISSTDNDGRTIWHYAAANNDYELLVALMVYDKDKEASLRRTTNIGRTPLAEAFAFVNELPDLSCELHEIVLQESIHYLLRHCRNDPAYLRSDIPVLCYVAEWGCRSDHRENTLIGPLLEAHSSFDLTTSDGSSPLHYLNLSAPRELILRLKQIPGVSELPVLNDAGLSPAETIFLAFKPSIDIYDGFVAHPSWHIRMVKDAHGQDAQDQDAKAKVVTELITDEEAYTELLTDEVISSRDKQGRTLWPRFCAHVLVHYIDSNWAGFIDKLKPSLDMALLCFRKRGVFEVCKRPRHAFWQQMGQSAPDWVCPDWVIPMLDGLPPDEDDEDMEG